VHVLVGAVGFKNQDVTDLREACGVDENEIFNRPQNWVRLEGAYLHPSQYGEVLSLQKQLSQAKAELDKTQQEKNVLNEETEFHQERAEAERQKTLEMMELLEQESGAMGRAVMSPRSESVVGGLGLDASGSRTSFMRPSGSVGSRGSAMFDRPRTSTSRDSIASSRSSVMSLGSVNEDANEPDAALSGPTKHRGWLQKEGGHTALTKSWDLRWCILAEGQLSYFKKREDKKPAGVISLVGGTCGASPFSGSQFRFEVKAKGEKRAYLFIAKDADDMNSWISKIQQHLE